MVVDQWMTLSKGRTTLKRMIPFGNGPTVVGAYDGIHLTPNAVEVSSTLLP